VADLERDFRFLVAANRRSVARLRTTADTTSSSGGRGKVLRAHLNKALSTISARVDRSEARYPTATSDIERGALIDSLRLLNRYVGGMQEVSPWLASADSPELHIGLLYFLDEAASALVGADSEIVTAPDATYQYATVSWPFRPILPSQPTGARPIIVFYPPLDVSSLLLHSLFAHELAHTAIDERGLLQSVLQPHFADTAFVQEFEQAAQDLATATNAPPPAARITLMGRVKGWITELLCDALATQYLGPSFLLAFGGVVLATSWNEPQERHPPTTLRVKLMLQQLRQRGWEDLLTAKVPNTLGWLADVASTGSATPTTHEKFLADTAQRVAGDVRAASQSALDTDSYAPAVFGEVAEEIAEFLRRRILPAQRQEGEAFDRRAVLLAGWLYIFESGEDDPTSIPAGMANDEFQNFLATALEMSSILEAWKAQ
jgi:hypothetical protein